MRDVKDVMVWRYFIQNCLMGYKTSKPIYNSTEIYYKIKNDLPNEA